MPHRNKKLYSTDLNTLNHLPVAVILFDNKKVYFLNSLAVKLFKVPKNYLNKLEQINIFNFLDKSFHKQIKENTKKILKGEDFPPLELKFKDFKNKTIFIEVKSNVVLFNNKEVVQSTFLEINNRIKEKIEAQEIKNLLEDTKQKFDLITQNGNDVISFYTYFPEEKYLYVSPNIKKVLGYEPKDLLKDCNFFNKRTEDYSGDFKKIDNLLKANQRKNNIKNHLYVYKTLNNKNEEVWIENNLAPILDKKGKIAFYLNVYRDITTQKEKELELELQRQNYQKLLDVTPTGYLIHKDGVCLYCNNALLKILKLKSYNQILGKFATDFVAEEHRKRILDRMKEVMSGVQINEPRTYLLLDSKKHEVEVEITSSTINYSNQLCIVSLISNISERKAQERQQLTIELTEKANKRLQEEIKQRQEVQKTLLEKTAHLTSILDNSTHLIWTVNRKFEITSFNNNFNKIVYQRFKIKLNSGINIFEKITDKSIKEKYQILWHTKYKEAFKGNKIEFEREDTDLNNNKIFRKIYINPILDKNNHVIEISCIAHDITETKVYEEQLINQSARLTAVIESGSHLVWTINKNLELTSYNQNFYKFVKNPKKDILQPNKFLKVREFVENPDKLKFWIEKYTQVLNGEKQIFTHKSTINGLDLYREISLHPIYSNNEIIEVSCIAQDITERVSNEQKLINQSAKLNAIFESGSQALWTINKKREITSHNKNYEMAVFNLHNAKPIIGKTLYDKEVGLQSNLDVYAKLWDEHYKIAFGGKSTEFITERLNKDGSKVIRQIYLQPIFNQNNNVDEVSGIAHDITDKKLSEQKALNQAAKLNSIFDSSHHYIWTIDTQQKLTSFNKNYFDLIANLYNTQPYIGLSLNRGILSNDVKYNELLQHHYQQAFIGNTATFEIEVLDINFNKLYLEVFLNPILHNNEVVEVSGIAHDITDKKLSQQKIEQSLKEKEILLKEVHHRVKNNMQVISSILNLQSSYVNDEYALALLKESQNRIKTMAYIHESLYQNKSFTSVNFSEYIETLAKNIIQSYSISHEKIQLKLNLQKTILNLDTSIPAGLIVNELITNAIKHAFPTDKIGTIIINLATENNIVFLEVKDTGKGFEDIIDFKNSPSLGLQLVNTLIDQIDGDLDFESDVESGTRILITFKM